MGVYEEDVNCLPPGWRWREKWGELQFFDHAGRRSRDPRCDKGTFVDAVVLAVLERGFDVAQWEEASRRDCLGQK